MNTITTEYLINALISDTQSQHDEGFNKAIIKLLKFSIIDPNQETRIYNLGRTFKKLDLFGYEQLSTAEILSLNDLILAGNKLAAVKYLKETLFVKGISLGLKDAKDVIEEYMK